MIYEFLKMNFPNEGDIWVMVKYGLEEKNPDFMNYNGKKLLIEFNGFYTHNKHDEIKRAEIFSKYGFKTLFLHYEDLNNNTLLKNKILNFVRASSVVEVGNYFTQAN